jgi:flagellar assembly protein FliH
MNCWSEKIQLAQPLRDVLTKNDGAMDEDPLSPEQLRLSYERGRREGENALNEQLLKQRTEIQGLMRGALNALSQAVPQVIRDTETLMTSLALNVAEKIVAQIPINAPMVEAAVRDALSQVEGTTQFTIRLHPDDLELLKRADSTVLNSDDGTNEFHFVASPEVTRGGCIVQTRFGTVDARRETKMDLLKKSLLP